MKKLTLISLFSISLLVSFNGFANTMYQCVYPGGQTSECVYSTCLKNSPCYVKHGKCQECTPPANATFPNTNQ